MAGFGCSPRNRPKGQSSVAIIGAAARIIVASAIKQTTRKAVANPRTTRIIAGCNSNEGRRTGYSTEPAIRASSRRTDAPCDSSKYAQSPSTRPQDLSPCRILMAEALQFVAEVLIGVVVQVLNGQLGGFR